MDVQVLTLRLVVAALFGGVIGYQRERNDRPAGFRTHILVSLGSALFMLVSELDFPVPTDPTRIAAQVVTGIGFLGAGTIIRQGNVVLGLTTAASLWSTAAVGLAAGAGYFTAAGIGTVMIFLALSTFKLLALKISEEHVSCILTVETTKGPEALGKIRARVDKGDCEVSGEELVRAIDGSLTVIIHLSCPDGADRTRLAQDLTGMEGVRRVRLERTPERPSQLF